MRQLNTKTNLHKNQLLKCLTEIQGLDQITGGGLPQCRPTLVCGTAGCGKILLKMEFIIHGATQYYDCNWWLHPLRKLLEIYQIRKKILVGLNLQKVQVSS